MDVPPAVGVRGPEDCLRHTGFIGAALCVQLCRQQTGVEAILVGRTPACLNGCGLECDVVLLLCQVLLRLRGYCIGFVAQIRPYSGSDRVPVS